VTSKRKLIAAKRKAAEQVRAKLGWTRTDWINEVESAFGQAAINWFQARLAERNGQRRDARKWADEFERELVRRVIDVHVHPLKREFDRREAFEAAVAEMPDTIERLREHVERQFGEAVGGVRRGLNDEDVQEFWRQVRRLAGWALFPDDHTVNTRTLPNDRVKRSRSSKSDV